MLTRLLGAQPQGVLVSDFYAVYDRLCWAAAEVLGASAA